LIREVCIERCDSIDNGCRSRNIDGSRIDIHPVKRILAHFITTIRFSSWILTGDGSVLR
jgi:hypothetical protein